MVFAELAGTPPFEPSILGETRGRGSYQPLIQSKRLRQGNQAAESDGAAARHEGVAENRHEERPTPQRPLAAETREEFCGGGAFAHFSHCSMKFHRDTENIDFCYFL